ncbi:MAG: hypothetical protein EBS75_11760 [Betaproteobacteria bacterium]|nr:hypothetical protein [Betaproteobacteria bacterium]
MAWVFHTQTDSVFTKTRTPLRQTWGQSLIDRAARGLPCFLKIDLPIRRVILSRQVTALSCPRAKDSYLSLLKEQHLF